MSQENVVGVTFDKMKVTAADEEATNRLNGFMGADYDLIRITNTTFTYDGLASIIVSPGYMNFNGRVVRFDEGATIPVSNISSNTKLFWVFDEALDNTATGEVGTSTYQAELNQGYFLVSNNGPVNVTSYIQLGHFISNIAFVEETEIQQNRNVSISIDKGGFAVRNNEGYIPLAFESNAPLYKKEVTVPSSLTWTLVRRGASVTAHVHGTVQSSKIAFGHVLAGTYASQFEGYKPDILGNGINFAYGTGDVRGSGFTARVEYGKASVDNDILRVMWRDSDRTLEGEYIDMTFNWVTSDPYPA